MKYQATILIELKPGILDPQGRAVEGVLQGLGYRAQNVRVGRVLEMELESPSEAEAHRQATEMAKTLANPVMEVYTVEALKERA
ncbi:phosphoribosylformylglycinamidine synthase subunit PurS [Meiothermus granaticius]|jgi:phosphoribosylformylglycinamidine synthase|uniref:Phosphoribosylformylglycinamidine synthase subunit PurS n=1 Tax=Meiothermus granaticius NBRC 107808 TaxID=1227551 RepID=A0A399F839_9DEIN|nr:phosphoribosylformylglycinamidine synthase subunit PurS [Meiothermus granaticius]MCL6526956.1 phosphoribosylformylglycinamidine synthase subunit PurS [Thermaceae bacterium]RIH92280.1 Phosphoribosylformylglycinamidine synthase subunit PurS [Meiothermus granaticius NBRC 107808]GEM86490.1 phosphoribosylformylglycinamidine synthase subunit PurS [Meiothermus granaticius NBRC 107808]